MGHINFWERTSLNVVTNVALTIVMALIGLFLVPYYLGTLGAAVYGIIPLATTVSSYVLIVSDSLVIACGRYVTLAIRNHEENESVKAFNTSMHGIIKTCLAFLPIIVLLAYCSPYLFSVPAGMNYDVQVMFLLVLVSSLIVSFTTSFNCVFMAYNRMYMVYLSRLAYTLSQVGLIYVMFTCASPSLIHIGFAYIASALVLLLLTILLFLKIRGNLKIDLHMHDRQLSKKMGILSAWAIGERTGDFLYIDFSLVLVNLYLGSALEAEFAIISTILNMTSSAILSISPSVQPILYRMYAENRENDIKRTIHISEKFLGYVMAVPFAFLMVFCPEILTAYVGSEYVDLSIAIDIGMLACAIKCCAFVMADVPVLYTKNKETMAFVLLFGLANILLTAIVLKITDWGINGAIVIWALCFAGQKLILILICVRITHARYRDYFLPVVQTYAVLSFCCLLFWGLDSLVDIGTSWLTIIPIFVACCCLLGLFVLRFFIPRGELSVIRNILPGFLKRFVPE